MATKRKGAAGVTPAAAITTAETPASLAPAEDIAATAVAETALADADSAIPDTTTLAEEPSAPGATENGQSDQSAQVPEGAAPAARPVTRVVVTLAQFLENRDEAGSLEVEVKARSAQGRWRIGKHFTSVATPLDFEMLNDDEIERLLADPLLLVTRED
jgi:hypothetical protein